MGCEHCEVTGNLPYTCSYCGGSFCAAHRLPEKHDCPGLVDATTLGPEFRGVGVVTRPRKGSGKLYDDGRDAAAPDDEAVAEQSAGETPHISGWWALVGLCLLPLVYWRTTAKVLLVAVVVVVAVSLTVGTGIGWVDGLVHGLVGGV